ncbi:uncharacterized protein LOC128198985 isoform X2 [Bicyclus anynana]|uniref:Uncharacterized protein LOC128198985 isoform X2 n=1 Tax=Bicyclus anynana TaxID=110368 RepID=A0ABM3LVK2_BICAN|nr:uncharacterized protein LOC128198985 isoform X2 [Bicyclus anynana]
MNLLIIAITIILAENTLQRSQHYKHCVQDDSGSGVCTFVVNPDTDDQHPYTVPRDDEHQPHAANKNDQSGYDSVDVARGRHDDDDQVLVLLSQSDYKRLLKHNQARNIKLNRITMG